MERLLPGPAGGPQSGKAGGLVAWAETSQIDLGGRGGFGAYMLIFPRQQPGTHPVRDCSTWDQACGGAQPDSSSHSELVASISPPRQHDM